MEYCNLEKYFIYFKTLSSKNGEYEGKCKLHVMSVLCHCERSFVTTVFKTDFPWKIAKSWNTNDQRWVKCFCLDKNNQDFPEFEPTTHSLGEHFTITT